MDVTPHESVHSRLATFRSHLANVNSVAVVDFTVVIVFICCYSCGSVGGGISPIMTVVVTYLNTAPTAAADTDGMNKEKENGEVVVVDAVVVAVCCENAAEWYP